MEITDSLPRPATELARSGFTAPTLPDVRGDASRARIVSQRHRYVTESHLLQWPCRQTAAGQRFHRFFEPRRRGHRHLLHAPGQVGDQDLLRPPPSSGPSTTHPLPQTQLHPLRHQHAVTTRSSPAAPNPLVELGTLLVVLCPDPRPPLSRPPPRSLPCPSPCVCTATAKA